MYDWPGPPGNLRPRLFQLDIKNAWADSLPTLSSQGAKVSFP